MMYSIERYLHECGYSYNGEKIDIMSHPVFEDARKALKVKWVEPKKQGLGNHPHRSMALDEEEGRVMWAKGVLGVKNPFSILFSLWYHITLLSSGTFSLGTLLSNRMTWM